MPAKPAKTATSVFTYQRAAALLPEVRQLTEEAIARVEEAQRAAQDATREDVQSVVAGWADAMLDRGLEVKGLWLVDFDNGSGYYCWRYPENGLEFFHTYEEGFRGRVRIQ
ncbi:MAG: DUF2203 family protein [Betaproteobacteria bacterium]